MVLIQWNQCSVSCGRGSRARYRRCTTPQNTIAFSCSGTTMDIASCDELPCVSRTNPSLTGQWASWSSWGQCSTTCGPGTQLRERVCQKEPCDGAGQERMACNLGECSGSAAQQWSDWGQWSECSRLCGKGVRSRSRSCKIPNACVGLSIEQGFCNEQPCSAVLPLSPRPANNISSPTPPRGSSGEWSSWSAWSACSVSCGVGVKRRVRNCNGGQSCPGDSRETAICNDKSCSTSDAQWGGWGYWSTCSETCGQGIRRRVRKCYGSGACFGNEYEKDSCTLRRC